MGGSTAWLAWLVSYIAGCELWRSRRARLAQARAAAEEADRHRGVQERLALARELHDALGHHVSLINVQAGVALYLIDDDPRQARTALAAIKQSSRELLAEMRVTLGVLRGVDEQPPRQPAAGLARIDDLVADNRSAGLPVAVRVLGDPRQLPAGVDLAAYRIVQESLTNTRRHARALTDREREVLALVAAGLSNDEIAQQLVVSPATAKTHVSRAMTKLGARDRAQLVVTGYESGLVRPRWLG